jgi:hypothetical protein
VFRALTLTFVFIAVLGVSLVAAWNTALAQTPTPTAGVSSNPVAIVKQFLDDENRGDVAGALTLVTDDAVIDGGSCQPPCVGKAAIQTDIEQGELAHTQHILADSTFQVSGNTVTARIEHQSDVAKAAGVDRFFVIATIQFTGDKISHISPRLDTTDPQTATLAAFQKTRQLAATGGGPSADGGGDKPMLLLVGIIFVIAGGFCTALGVRRRS